MVTIGTSDLNVHPLALGGNVFGWTADQELSFAVLDAYTARGGNFVDTADVYSAWAEGNSGGESETILGEWMARRGNRDAVVLATKAGAHPEFKGLGAATLKAAVEASLRRLRTDRIDLLYTHYQDPDTPVEETIGALDELVRAGKVRHIAASNHSPERLAASLAVSDEGGLARYVAYQGHYNLVEREEYEDGGMRELISREGLGFLPYYALASGFLTGKYRPGAEAAGARAGRATEYLRGERGPRVLAALDEVAAARGVSVTAVSLAWLVAKPTVTAPIASARKPEQLDDLLTGVELELSAEEVRRLDEASA
ncbi:aldo/keto reductase [Allostreptomyces psammosilenae]|uniref:Aryl-alcohol dehydrogenase-like predicted oxidoreductase n=1 Tax=Allostreptomyces psammosilenae TaxID=1892865 RepID=A0A852ZV62_9ACTN|nr:aldo/keto reductase [Allostreptomyces psammosilenae]NYI05507.1 aryl-alcohol dehydrogenase-like predicted oxidoreductase [Allostreptomyces psammosilenae]